MFQVQEISRRSLPPAVAKAGHLARTGGDPIGDRLRLFLKTKTFLGGLSDAALDALIRRGHVKKYLAGEVICRRQERGDSLMLIMRGLIKIANDNPDGKEVVLNFLGTGDTYGEMAVFGGQTRTADAVALEESESFRCLRARPHARTGCASASSVRNSPGSVRKTSSCLLDHRR